MRAKAALRARGQPSNRVFQTAPLSRPFRRLDKSSVQSVGTLPVKAVAKHLERCRLPGAVTRHQNQLAMEEMGP